MSKTLRTDSSADASAGMEARPDAARDLGSGAAGGGEGAQAAFAIHDLKNLLATVRGHAELQLERLRGSGAGDKALLQSLEAIRLASDRAVRLCRSHLETAGGRMRRQEMLAVGETVRGALRLFQGRADGLRCRASGPPEIEISGVRDDLERGVLNLLWNARDALYRAGKHGQEALIRVSWGQDRTGAWIEVADNGPGLPGGRLPAPGASSAGESPAHGLGLREVARIARQHGGRLCGVNHPVLGGAVMRLEFGIQRELEFESGETPPAPVATQKVVPAEHPTPRASRRRQVQAPPAARP